MLLVNDAIAIQTDYVSAILREYPDGLTWLAIAQIWQDAADAPPYPSPTALLNRLHLLVRSGEVERVEQENNLVLYKWVQNAAS